MNEPLDALGLPATEAELDQVAQPLAAALAHLLTCHKEVQLYVEPSSGEMRMSYTPDQRADLRTFGFGSLAAGLARPVIAPADQAGFPSDADGRREFVTALVAAIGAAICGGRQFRLQARALTNYQARGWTVAITEGPRPYELRGPDATSLLRDVARAACAYPAEHDPMARVA